jgi:hypothetical protein
MRTLPLSRTYAIISKKLRLTNVLNINLIYRFIDLSLETQQKNRPFLPWMS